MGLMGTDRLSLLSNERHGGVGDPPPLAVRQLDLDPGAALIDGSELRAGMERLHKLRLEALAVALPDDDFLSEDDAGAEDAPTDGPTDGTEANP